MLKVRSSIVIASSESFLYMYAEVTLFSHFLLAQIKFANGDIQLYNLLEHCVHFNREGFDYVLTNK